MEQTVQNFALLCLWFKRSNISETRHKLVDGLLWSYVFIKFGTVSSIPVYTCLCLSSPWL